MKYISIFLVSLFIHCSLPHENRSGGAMLYTVRDSMSENPKETIRQVADLGYKYVEVAGYKDGTFYGMSPIAFKAFLEENGLTAISSHQGDVNMENADQMIADVKAAGIKYFVIPVPPMGQFTYNPETHEMGMTAEVEELAQQLTVLGEKCSNQGIQLLYHNHDFEFFQDENGDTIMDYLLQHTSPQYVNFQMDLYWITKAKADPLVYFDKYPGRFKTWHVKDMNQQGLFTPVGEGIIDFSTIVKAKEQSGMRYYFVEQDRTFNGRKPMEALSISKNNLKRLGFNKSGTYLDYFKLKQKH